MRCGQYGVQTVINQWEDELSPTAVDQLSEICKHSVGTHQYLLAHMPDQTERRLMERKLTLVLISPT